MSITPRKICMLTSRHRFDDPRIYYKEAITLWEAGYEVSIIAPNISRNHPQNGIQVITFTKWKVFRKLSSILNLVSHGYRQKAEYLLCHEGDSSLLAGVLIKVLCFLQNRKVILIYDSHESWMHSFYDKAFVGTKTLTKVLFAIYELSLGVFVDSIITANELVRGYFQTVFPRKKVSTLYNVPKEGLFKGRSTQKNYDQDRIVFCHEGRIRFDRGITPLFSALTRLVEKRADFEFVFVGDVKTEKERAFIEREMESHPELRSVVTVTGWLPYEEVGPWLDRCHVGCIFLEPTMNNMVGGPPNKLFNYLCYRLPIIAPDYPEITKIVSEYNCGILLNEINSATIYVALSNLLNKRDTLVSMSRNAQNAYEQKYNWEIQKPILLNAIYSDK